MLSNTPDQRLSRRSVDTALQSEAGTKPANISADYR